MEWGSRVSGEGKRGEGGSRSAVESEDGGKRQPSIDLPTRAAPHHPRHHHLVLLHYTINTIGIAPNPFRVPNSIGKHYYIYSQKIRHTTTQGLTGWISRKQQKDKKTVSSLQGTSLIWSFTAALTQGRWYIQAPSLRPQQFYYRYKSPRDAHYVPSITLG